MILLLHVVTHAWEMENNMDAFFYYMVVVVFSISLSANKELCCKPVYLRYMGFSIFSMLIGIAYIFYFDVDFIQGLIFESKEYPVNVAISFSYVFIGAILICIVRKALYSSK